MTLLLWICFWGALLELDTTYAFQLTFSRGIVAGPLLGLVCGNVMTGLQVGIFTELLFIDVSPLGGALPPSAAICCALTMALVSLQIPVYFAFFVGVLGAILFAQVELYMRRRRSAWMARQEQKIRRNPAYIRHCVAEALSLSFMTNLAFLLVLSTGVGFALAQLVAVLPEKMQLAGKFSYMAVPWIGLSTLLSTFRLKTR